MYKFPSKSKASVVEEIIEYVVAGSGLATVVLVNGSGGPIEGWYKVFEPIAGFAKVFAYNRPGATAYFCRHGGLTGIFSS